MLAAATKLCCVDVIGGSPGPLSMSLMETPIGWGMLSYGGGYKEQEGGSGFDWVSENSMVKALESSKAVTPTTISHATIAKRDTNSGDWRMRMMTTRAEQGRSIEFKIRRKSASR